MSTEFESFDDFMGHQGATGTGGRRLKGWKEKGRLDAWIHTKRLPVGVWRHSFPRLIVMEEDGVAVKKIWPVSFVCPESEAILKEMYKRTPDDQREVPPEKCAFCKLIEYTRQQVIDGAWEWIDEIFKFEGASDPKQNTILHAGGIYNAFGSKKLTTEEKAEMKRHRIYQTESWKENAMPKLSYVFPIVDNDNIAAGIQITVENDLLKRKVVECINKERESEGVEEGDPTQNPYCIRFVYRDKEEDFKAKYDALRMRKISISSEIERLITGPAPDLSMFTDTFNPATLRSIMERHAVVEFPWDDLFDGVEAKEEEEEEEEKPKKRSANKTLPKKAKEEEEDDEDALDDEEEEEEEEKPKKKGAVDRAIDKKKSEKAAKTETKSTKEVVEEEAPRKRRRAKEEEWGDPCDECKAPMKKGAVQCTKCGAKYEDDGSDTGQKPPF